MTIACPKCSTQIDLSGTNNPTRPFVVRCPKCNSTVSVSSASPASEKSALALGQSPATERRRFETSEPAPLFQFQTEENEVPANAPAEDMTHLLAKLLNQNVQGGNNASGPRPSWNPRKALICTAANLRDRLARQLAANGYQVFVAQDTRQAVDRMRENQLDVVVLDPEFDSDEQGAAFVMREVNILRPAERRRIFFVMLSPTQRTMEAHAAFLNNVNAIVNLRDVEDLPKIIGHALRDFNELYKEFNLALNLPAL